MGEDRPGICLAAIARDGPTPTLTERLKHVSHYGPAAARGGVREPPSIEPRGGRPFPATPGRGDRGPQDTSVRGHRGTPDTSVRGDRTPSPVPCTPGAGRPQDPAARSGV